MDTANLTEKALTAMYEFSTKAVDFAKEEARSVIRGVVSGVVGIAVFLNALGLCCTGFDMKWLKVKLAPRM